MSSKPNIAILGARSHIAKGLIARFLRDDLVALSLFTRSPPPVIAFLQSIGRAPSGSCSVKEGYRDFPAGDHDVVINCVGLGPPRKLQGNYSDWFTVTEEYDNLAIGYLRKRPATLYVNFSSGAVYGVGGVAPVTEDSVNRISVNHLSTPDYYAIAKLNSETKHRALDSLRIVDLRVFAYFSRFIDLNSGYFIADVLKCVLGHLVLETNGINIVRDYVHPEDMFSLILLCMKAGRINAAFDVMSSKPTDKREILACFSSAYGLKYEVKESAGAVGPNGVTAVYCSGFNKAAAMGYRPTCSSMDTIKKESAHILGR